ncbi:uncharacterized protein BYT42DRAFT_619449 [Radiomyces spectabilis]|uniref:uncharacterized protein n=1 Tax=Radiomyces spectabilis TaxID=64574 RepID=UPI002220E6C3|nr:uncharacterized protein BYT42DRAFT_619449 [Radiomyces spectabilis]KAI8393501.1 hypothetical protein BYT42DRAFT_619449 [Radiomyces spectabilis]
MDPYEQTFNESAMPDADLDDSEIQKLEKELAPQSSDYYALLNVSKTATPEELKEAYKRLCRFFHPDKHNDSEKKKLAEARFQVIHHAYEVLSDPMKRVIYDTYGEEGLNASWEVGHRYKTTEELRAEYEHKARLQREQDLENLVRSRGEFHLGLDLSQVFDPYEPPVFPTGFGQPITRPKPKGPLHALKKTQVQQLFMRHSFETPIGTRTHAVIGGSMVSRSGLGGGNIMGTIRHTVSPKLWGEFTATLLKPRGCTLKTFYTVSSDSFVNTTVQTRTLAAPPVLSVTAGRRLFTTTTGYITYRTGEWSLLGWGGDVSRKSDRSSLSLGLAGAKKKGNYTVELQTGIISSHIAADYTHKMMNQMQLRVSGSLSTVGGIVASLGSDHKLSEHTRFGMSMECGLASGVVVKFRVSRLGQKIVLPFILSNEFDAKLAFFGAVLPASVAFAVDHFVLKPRRRRQIQEKIQELREEHADYLASKKEQALDAQRLMSEISDRKKKQEEKKKDGLVIVKALYGHLENLKDDDSEEETEGVIDVTVVIQTLVNESRLTIPGGHSKVKHKENEEKKMKNMAMKARMDGSY